MGHLDCQGQISSEYFVLREFLMGKIKGSGTRAKIRKKLSEQNKIITINGTEYITQDVASEIVASLSKHLDGYITWETAHRKYGVSQAQLTNLSVEGRITPINGRYPETEIRKLQEMDRQLSSLSTVLDKICALHPGLVVTKKLVTAIEERIIRTDAWGEGYRRRDALCCKAPDKSKLYLHDNPELLKKIDDAIRENADLLPVEAYVYLWEQMTDNEIKLLVKQFGVEPNMPNLQSQPDLHHIMALLAKSRKEICDLNNGEIDLMKRGMTERTKKNFNALLRLTYDWWPEKCKYNPNLLQYRRHKEVRKRDVNAYDEYTYFEFGRMIFESKSFALLVPKVLESSRLAQIVLSFTMPYIGAWRDTDIVRMRAATITDLQDKISKLQNGDYELEDYRDVWVATHETKLKEMRAHKTGLPIHLFCPLDFEPMLGVLITIAEYHRICDKRDTLIDPQTLKQAKRIDLEQLFNPEAYNKLFGKTTARRGKLNKCYLRLQRDGAQRKIQNAPKTLSIIIAAYVRGHKLDLKNGQDTIFHYIDAKHENLSMDEITEKLFEIGTMGFYKEAILKYIYPAYAQMTLTDKAKMIKAADIVPIDTESLLAKMEVIQHQLNQAIEETLPTTYNELCARIMRVVHCGSVANEENVDCLYVALTGYRNEACRGQGNCLHCQNADDSKYGLCKYGIYGREYIINLRDRYRYFIGRANTCEEELARRSDNIIILQNEYQRCKLAAEQLEKTIDTFLASFGLDPKLRDKMIEDLNCSYTLPLLED